MAGEGEGDGLEVAVLITSPQSRLLGRFSACLGLHALSGLLGHLPAGERATRKGHVWGGHTRAFRPDRPRPATPWSVADRHTARHATGTRTEGVPSRGVRRRFRPARPVPVCPPPGFPYRRCPKPGCPYRRRFRPSLSIRRCPRCAHTKGAPRPGAHTGGTSGWVPYPGVFHARAPIRAALQAQAVHTEGVLSPECPYR